MSHVAKHVSNLITSDKTLSEHGVLAGPNTIGTAISTNIEISHKPTAFIDVQQRKEEFIKALYPFHDT
jgi:hypothetical protein